MNNPGDKGSMKGKNDGHVRDHLSKSSLPLSMAPPPSGMVRKGAPLNLSQQHLSSPSIKSPLNLDPSQLSSSSGAPPAILATNSFGTTGTPTRKLLHANRREEPFSRSREFKAPIEKKMSRSMANLPASPFAYPKQRTSSFSSSIGTANRHLPSAHLASGEDVTVRVRLQDVEVEGPDEDDGDDRDETEMEVNTFRRADFDHNYTPHRLNMSSSKGESSNKVRPCRSNDEVMSSFKRKDSKSASCDQLADEKARVAGGFQVKLSRLGDKSSGADQLHRVDENGRVSEVFSSGSGVKNTIEPNSTQGGSDDAFQTNNQTRLRESGGSKSPCLPIENATSASHKTSVPSTINSSDGFNHAEASLLLGMAESGIPKKETTNSATIPNAMTSFLDALSEEQRRVRHRHIPAVDGFRKLYKSEIKRDLSMARVSDLGHHKRSNKARQGASAALGEIDADSPPDFSKGEGTDVEDEDSTLSDNDTTSDQSLGGGKTLSKGSGSDRKSPHPFGAFVPVFDKSSAAAFRSSLTSPAETTTLGGEVRNAFVRSPQFVESITAFTPPRPQESIGSKTKHRMKRWECNPQDLEVDLVNYRKTVQRTRKELHRAEEERSRIETLTTLIRTHLTNHIVALRDELSVLNEQLKGTLSECLTTAELFLTNLGDHSTTSMEDVVSILKSLGDEFQMNGIRETRLLTFPFDNDWRVPGVGGIATPSPFPKSVRNDHRPLATGWILCGDQVVTPSGEGLVGRVFCVGSSGAGPSISDELTRMSAENEQLFSSSRQPEGRLTSNSVTKKDSKSTSLTFPDEIKLHPERICVRLSYGLGYFTPLEVKLKSRQFCFSNHDLLQRWENMVETAISMGVCHDYVGMGNISSSSISREIEISEVCQKESSDQGLGAAESNSRNEVRSNELSSNNPSSNIAVKQCPDARAILQFGSGLLAAPLHIRNNPSLIPVETLEKVMKGILYGESFSEAQASTPKICFNASQIESRREELNHLKGKVMQLRNRLGRQKRIRNLNERSLIAGQNRSQKVEGLLIEMQMDLRNLKERLQDELYELGMEPSKSLSISGCHDADKGDGTDKTRVKSNPSAAEGQMLFMGSKCSRDNDRTPHASHSDYGGSPGVTSNHAEIISMSKSRQLPHDFGNSSTSSGFDRGAKRARIL